MLKILAVAGLAIVAATNVADAASDEFCKILGDTARAIMTQRQNEVPVSQLLADLASVKAPPAMEKLNRSIILMAYNASAFDIDVRAKAVAEFGNKIEALCYE